MMGCPSLTRPRVVSSLPETGMISPELIMFREIAELVAAGGGGGLNGADGLRPTVTGRKPAELRIDVVGTPVL
jgi:hypothetical protein